MVTRVSVCMVTWVHEYMVAAKLFLLIPHNTQGPCCEAHNEPRRHVVINCATPNCC